MAIERFEKNVPRNRGAGETFPSCDLDRRRFFAAGAAAAWALASDSETGAAPVPPFPRGPMEARFYDSAGGGAAICGVCPRHCVIPEGKRGFCSTRENRAGKLYSLVYGRVAAMNVDPIEKKPFFHVLPGLARPRYAATRRRAGGCPACP